MAGQSISTRMAPNYLFNQLREMHVVYSGDTRSTPSKSEMKLKIYERSLDNNEREIRAELSCSTDDDFVYAGGVTKTSFPRLLEKFTLTVDFENFAKKLIAQLCPSDPKSIDVYVVLSEDRSKCTLQICRSSDIQRYSLPLEMRSLKGEELLAYLKGSLRSQRRTVMEQRKSRNEAEERIVRLEREVEKMRDVEEENRRIKENLKEAVEEADEYRMDLSDMKQKFEVIEGENEELKGEIEELKGETEGLKNELDELHRDVIEAYDAEDEAKKNIEELNKEIENLNSNIQHLTNDLRYARDELKEANDEINSLVQKLKKKKDSAIAEKVMKFVRNDETPLPSCDEGKMREMEGSIKEKEELIEQMTTKIADLTKEKELLKENFESARIQMEEANRKLQIDVDNAKRLVDVYRRSPSASHGITAITSPHYTQSPLTYHTPPTTVPMHTPSTARLSSMARFDLQHRPPLASHNRPLTPVHRGIMDGSTGPVAPSPRVISYSRANADKKN